MLGFGLALPFLLIALVPAVRARLPRPGAWMTTFRRWLALPMALTVVGLVWLLGRQVGAPGWLIGTAAALVALFQCWMAGVRQRRGESGSVAFFLLAASIVPFALLLPAVTTPAARGPTGALNAEPWSAARVAALRAAGTPLFVYFTADWCVSCKVNEATSIDRDETAGAFRAAGVRTLVADWTNGDAAITRELATHDRNSVPLYLWYPAGGGAPEVLPQVLTPAMLRARAAATGQR
jgi:thiol:disulfide interchange protein